MAKDGYESDHARVMVYNLETHARRLVTENWDRSTAEIVVRSHCYEITEPSLMVFSLPIVWT